MYLRVRRPFEVDVVLETCAQGLSSEETAEILGDRPHDRSLVRRRVLTVFSGEVARARSHPAMRYWSPDYVQHSAHIEPGRDGLFNLIKSVPATLIAADILRIVDGVLVEHWDVLQDEASQAESKSGLPMFRDSFTE